MNKKLALAITLIALTSIAAAQQETQDNETDMASNMTVYEWAEQHNETHHQQVQQLKDSVVFPFNQLMDTHEQRHHEEMNRLFEILERMNQTEEGGQ